MKNIDHDFEVLRYPDQIVRDGGSRPKGLVGIRVTRMPNIDKREVEDFDELDEPAYLRKRRQKKSRSN